MQGIDPVRENTNDTLMLAMNNGFDVEFDIYFTIDRKSLVLSHDEAE